MLPHAIRRREARHFCESRLQICKRDTHFCRFGALFGVKNRKNLQRRLYFKLPASGKHALFIRKLARFGA